MSFKNICNGVHHVAGVGERLHQKQRRTEPLCLDAIFLRPKVGEYNHRQCAHRTVFFHLSEDIVSIDSREKNVEKDKVKLLSTQSRKALVSVLGKSGFVSGFRKLLGDFPTEKSIVFNVQHAPF